MRIRRAEHDALAVAAAFDVALSDIAHRDRLPYREPEPLQTALHPRLVSGERARNDRVLFVGSNTAPNVVGLKWFIAEVWPRVRQASPGVELHVAGWVARAAPAPGEGVRLLGVVRSLRPHYAEAGVVISPLLTASGLKVKGVEALGAGKAVVGSSVSAQGVEEAVRGAMVVEDDPAAFAAAVIALLASPADRQELCARATNCARVHFARGRCYGPVVEALRNARSDALAEVRAAASA